MKLLVIGAAGRLGSELLSAAQRRADDATGTWSSTPGPGLVHFDLRQNRIVECLGRDFFLAEPVQVVICSSICQIDECARNPDSRRVNVDGTIRLIDDLAPLGAKVVFISSSYVFDGAAVGRTEEEPVNPICTYGRHKAAVEAHLRDRADDSLVIRLDKLVDDRPDAGNIFYQWVQQVEREGRVLCIAQQHFSPTAVSDAAQAILAACDRGLRGIYHFAGGDCVRRDELARRFLSLWGREVPIVARPQSEFNFAEARPLKTCLNTDRFRAAIKMEYTPMDELMRRLINNL